MQSRRDVVKYMGILEIQASIPGTLNRSNTEGNELGTEKMRPCF